MAGVLLGGSTTVAKGPGPGDDAAVAVGAGIGEVGPVSCDEAPGGYKGRKAIFEMMIMNNEIRELAFELAPSSKIRKAAITAGMKELVEDGRLKVLNGVTTPEEIARVSQSE